jgi:hypothetical protein
MTEPMPEMNQSQNPIPIVTPKRGRPRKNQLFNPIENISTTENSGKTVAPKGRKGWEEVVRQQLNDMWSLAAVGMTFVNPIDAQIIAERAPRITEAIIHLAQVKPAFKKMLLRTSEGALYTEIIVAIVPIAVLIACNHKLLPSFVAIPYGGMPKMDNGNTSNGTDKDAIPFDVFSVFSQAMATGGTSNDNWPDGKREDDISS